MSGPARRAAPRVQQRYFERWTYDARIFGAALAVALPPTLVLGALLIWRDLPWAALGTLGGIAALFTAALALRLRNRVIYPLYTLSNLLEALREGDELILLSQTLPDLSRLQSPDAT